MFFIGSLTEREWKQGLESVSLSELIDTEKKGLLPLGNALSFSGH